MSVNPTYPGVYVQELPSGVRTIAGVGTSTGLFIGRASQGPLNKAMLCLNFSEYERNFSDDSSFGEMPHQVKLFFANGGTSCYALRIANGAQSAAVTLQTEGGTPTLTLTAKQAGTLGDTLRATVEYRGQQPEATFNISIFKVATNAAGVEEALETENWQNLSMDPASPLFAADFISQNSALVNAAVDAGSPAPTNGRSQSGLPVVHDSTTAATFQTAWDALLGANGSANEFQISVDGSAYVSVDLSAIDVSALAGPALADFQNQLAAAIVSEIEDAFTTANLAGTTLDLNFTAGPTPSAGQAPNDASTLLQFVSQNDGDIYVRTGANNDLGVPLRLGTAQGGLEVSAYSAARPAPTGISMQMSDTTIWNAFASLRQDAITQITLPALDTSSADTTAGVNVNLAISAAAENMFQGGGVTEKLAAIRDAINTYQLANRRTFFWHASLAGYRLILSTTNGTDNTISAISMSPTDFPTAQAGSFLSNVRRFRLGTGGTSGTQEAGVAGDNGAPPQLSDYEDAYNVIKRDVDLFNLLVLPRDAEPAQPMSDLYGPASVFAQEQRAFLLMEPPASWTSAQLAAENVDSLRLGLVNDHSAVFYPNVTINDNGLLKNVGPAGAIAGLMARIDSARGVWKAPAGIEASLRNVVGLQYRLSDDENGVVNPRAVNAIRIFPNGIINWGARTMDGDNDFGSEYKYIPIRRLALYLEESLFRGLKWVVFEPNDEPLWSQIRLNVGAFMHGLFRQGAFQGSTPKDAYFVKCDSETTTQADRNLGIVNIVVGFAPLKPAEFVILSIQQIAGQLES